MEFNESQSETSEPANQKNRFKKGKEEEELRKMMIGFGDEPNPSEKSLDLLDEYMADFLINLVSNSYKRSMRRNINSNQLMKEDLLYFIQPDTKKLMRVAHIDRCYEKWQRIVKKTYPDPDNKERIDGKADNF